MEKRPCAASRIRRKRTVIPDKAAGSPYVLFLLDCRTAGRGEPLPCDMTGLFYKGQFSFFLRLRDLVRIADAPTREVKHKALHMPMWDISAVFGLALVL